MDFIVRAPLETDLPGLVALAHAGAEESGIPSTASEDAIRMHWQRPHFVRERHHRVADLGGTIVGEASLWREGDTVEGGGFVMRAHRGRGIGSVLLRWLMDTARSDLGAAELFTWADSQLEDAAALIGSAPGAEYVRSFIRMMNRTPSEIAAPEWPAGIRLEPFRGDALIDKATEALNNSFVDHWNFTPADRSEFAYMLERSDEDPTLWFIAVAEDGTIAGFNICHLQAGDGFVRGGIGPLGTTRPFRGIGLGRALLRHGVRVLADRGATEVMLGVDSQNPNGAVGLYERNGFEAVRRGNIYRIKL